MAASHASSHANHHYPAREYSVPFSGPNAVNPAFMTPDERRAEIAAIMTHGVLRRLSRTPNPQMGAPPTTQHNML